MPTPTLGCQIAPDYNDQSSSESDLATTEDLDDERRGSQTEAERQLNIEKAETQHESAITTRPSRQTSLAKRTRSGRSHQPPEEPVSFWHWQIVGVPVGFEVQTTNRL